MSQELADRVHVVCLERNSAIPDTDLYNEAARASYARLEELSREYVCRPVAVQYLARPVDELMAYLPGEQ
jgi:hypothetical protein